MQEKDLHHPTGDGQGRLLIALVRSLALEAYSARTVLIGPQIVAQSQEGVTKEIRLEPYLVSEIGATELALRSLAPLTLVAIVIRPLLGEEALQEFYRARYDSVRQFLAKLLARLAGVTQSPVLRYLLEGERHAYPG